MPPMLADRPRPAQRFARWGAHERRVSAAGRRGALEELVAEWEPEAHPELERFVRRLSDDLAEQAPRAS